MDGHVTLACGLNAQHPAIVDFLSQSGAVLQARAGLTGRPGSTQLFGQFLQEMPISLSKSALFQDPYSESPASWPTRLINLVHHRPRFAADSSPEI